MKYYLYILQTTDNTLYCGIARDVQKRFQEHLSGKGAKYTRSHKPLKIVYTKEFENKSEALKEEIRKKKSCGSSVKTNSRSRTLKIYFKFIFCSKNIFHYFVLHFFYFGFGAEKVFKLFNYA